MFFEFLKIFGLFFGEVSKFASESEVQTELRTEIHFG